MVTTSNKLTQQILPQQDSWDQWQESGYTQLDQYAKQHMFGEPCPVTRKSAVFNLTWTRCQGIGRSQESALHRIFYAFAAEMNLLVFRADVSNTFGKAPPPNRDFKYVQTRPSKPLHVTLGTNEQFHSELYTAKGNPDAKAQAALAKQMKFGYQKAIDELIWPMTTCRLDLSQAVVKCSQASAAPTNIHYNAVKSIFCYLAATMKGGIYYWRPHPEWIYQMTPSLTSTATLMIYYFTIDITRPNQSVWIHGFVIDQLSIDKTVNRRCMSLSCWWTNRLEGTPLTYSFHFFNRGRIQCRQ
eukprot:CCRYP_000414-RA/>CCRYP_000414-RA protein AED:0.37 eAED:0.37 QI:0/0/0/1/0/0/2/0/298